MIVEGRVLMQGRKLQHLDRDALAREVAAAAASSVARRSPGEHAWIEQIGRRIAEHYQAPVWQAGRLPSA